MKHYIDFSNWLDKYLINDLPNEVTVVNFNLYEGAENTYDIEIVGCVSFDENDEDWACNEVFNTREDLFSIPRKNDIKQWEQGLHFITALVNRYIENGRYANKLKNYEAIGIGFVSGSIDIIQRAK